MLAELDEVIDGQATRSYQRHIVQDWNAEPYVGTAYLADVPSLSISRRLAVPVPDRLFSICIGLIALTAGAISSFKEQ